MQAVVQLRGEVNIETPIRDTLEMLNLHRVNHCALVPETESYTGMIAKVNDFVAFGEPSASVVETLLRRRAEPLEGSAAIDDEWVSEHTDYADVETLADALLAEETKLTDEGLAPVIRLHPPRSGHDGLKNPASEGGQLGTHSTAEIDDLLTAMR